MAKVINRERLRRKIRSLAPTIRDGIRVPMERGAQEVVDLAIHLCPVGSTRALANSIDWSWGDAPRSARMGSKGGKVQPPANSEDLIITMHAGNDRAYYARWVEFGTRPGRTHPGSAPRPYFFPAYRAHKDHVKRSITSAVNKAVKKNAAIS